MVVFLVAVVPVSKDWGLGNRVMAVRVQEHATNLSPVHLGVRLGLHTQSSYLSQAAGPCASSGCWVLPGSPCSPVKTISAETSPGKFLAAARVTASRALVASYPGGYPLHGDGCVFCFRFRANSGPPALGTSTAARTRGSNHTPGAFPSRASTSINQCSGLP